MKVAFQGERGAYSELAAIKHFGKSIKTIPCKNLSDVFKTVEKGKANFGIVPVENSLEGSIGQTYDLLLNSRLKVSGEAILRIIHCLIAHPNTNIKIIKRIYSHPQALGQCIKFIERKKFQSIATYDTAGSVQMIKKMKDKKNAAIASELAADIYGMKVLAKGIEANPNNFTRFFIISKNDSPITGNDKTSVLFTLKHKPGTLVNALKAFADRSINLEKLESRPTIGKPWEYNFYLDFQGHISEKKIKDAIQELKSNSTFVKILGSYPKVKNNAV